MPRILIIDTYYPQFLDDLYQKHPDLSSLNYDQQIRSIFAQHFGVSDAYSTGLHAAGADAKEIICNADVLQSQWAKEHNLDLVTNIHDRRRQIVAAQIREHKPDVLLVFEWCPLGDTFLAEMKSNVRFLAGQIASPLPPKRTFTAYDCMISFFPPILNYFHRRGLQTERMNLAFDDRILTRLSRHPIPSRDRQSDVGRVSPANPSRDREGAVTGRSLTDAHDPECIPRPAPKYDVSFVGGFASNHTERITWLEDILAEIPIHIFGYGLEQTAPDSAIRRHHNGQVWGLQMYNALHNSKITLNFHARIDVEGEPPTSTAGNMRMFEATGVGTCLLTESKENLSELFDPAREITTFKDSRDCIDKIKYLLTHNDNRNSIALAGQSKSLRDHTYSTRTRELLDLFLRHL